MDYSNALPPSADRLQYDIASKLWKGDDLGACALIRRYIEVVRATPHQIRANGAGFEIEVADVLPKAYVVPNLGAPDGIQAHATENKWLARLRRHADKNGCPVVRKWQNRLVFDAAVERFRIDALADLLASWITTEFHKRFVTAVERATVSLAEGDYLVSRINRPWLGVIDDIHLLFAAENVATMWAEGVLKGTPWHILRPLWLQAIPK